MTRTVCACKAGAGWTGRRGDHARRRGGGAGANRGTGVFNSREGRGGASADPMRREQRRGRRVMAADEGRVMVGYPFSG